MKSLGLSSKEGNKPKFLLNKEDTIQFEPQENANAFKKFYSELATNLVKKLLFAPNRFCSSTSKDYTAVIFNKKIIQFQLLNVCKDVKKILCLMNTNTTEGMDQKPAKFLKAADVLAKVINLLANLSVFSEHCKILR